MRQVLERFIVSNIYPSGSLSSTHPAISEDILIYFVAHCVNALQLKYSTIKRILKQDSRTLAVFRMGSHSYVYELS